MQKIKTAHNIVFCGSGTGRKASVICCNPIGHLFRQTFFYRAIVLNFSKILSLGLPSPGATNIISPTGRQALAVSSNPKAAPPLRFLSFKTNIMKRAFCKLILSVFFMSSSLHLTAQQTADLKKILGQKYNLVPQHSRDTQYYDMESKLQKHALDGTIQGVDVYHLYLRCVPSTNSSKGDEYTCLKFTIQINNSTPISIPSLTNWKYFFSLGSNTKKDSSIAPLFGIDHSKFEKLTDQNGKNLPLENTFHVYNAFIDFHSMSVFAEKAAKDSGAQDLKYVGDKIIHAASFSQPHEGLGTQVSEDSYFKNGKITLEFKGLGLINKKTCAIMEYDSGESSFYMLTKPMANMEVRTKGSSHYWGDIYKDLSTGWIQKAVMHELVVSETIVPGLNNKINSVIERTIDIKNAVRLNL